MHTTPTHQPATTIPPRVKEVPPLIVQPEDEATQKVREQIGATLDDLGRKLAEIHNTAAEGWLSQGNYDKALTHMAAAVSLVPASLAYLHQHGVVCYLAGEDDRAVESFTAVLKTDPTNADTLFNLGMVLFGDEQLAEAEDCFRRSSESDPDHAECWNNRGVCLFKLGRVQDARDCFQKALSLEPGNQDARCNLDRMEAGP